jgi:hypothetical protein
MAVLDGNGRFDAGRPQSPPAAFTRAAAAVAAVQPRPEVRLAEVPAPQRLARYAVALSADVLDPSSDGQTSDEPDELGSGRWVLLHEPGGMEAWDGEFRVVSFARAVVDPEMGADPLLAEVAWSWLRETVADHGLRWCRPSGTVTRVTNTGFGALADQRGSAELEIRASWTPLPAEQSELAGDHLAAHAEAWLDLLATACGLPPLPEGVLALPRPRRAP